MFVATLKFMTGFAIAYVTATEAYNLAEAHNLEGPLGYAMGIIAIAAAVTLIEITTWFRG